MSRGYVVCPTCRELHATCNHRRIMIGHRWRPPKRNNDKAWKRIAEGDIWWDRRAISSRAINRGARNFYSHVLEPVYVHTFKGTKGISKIVDYKIAKARDISWIANGHTTIEHGSITVGIDYREKND